MKREQATYSIRAPPPPAPPPLGPFDHTPSVDHPPVAAHPPLPRPPPPSVPPLPPHPPLEPLLAPFVHAVAGRAFPVLPHDNPRTQQYPALGILELDESADELDLSRALTISERRAEVRALPTAC